MSPMLRFPVRVDSRSDQTAPSETPRRLARRRRCAIYSWQSVMSEPCGSHSFFAVRRRADRTMTLSQIVHLRARSHEYTLRGMLNRTLILITSAASLPTHRSYNPCALCDDPHGSVFRQPQRDRAVFSPDADGRHEACCAIGP